MLPLLMETHAAVFLSVGKHPQMYYIQNKDLHGWKFAI